MNRTHQSTFFNAIPGQTDPLLLRSCYQKKLLESLKIYFSALSKSLNIDFTLQTKKIDALDVERRFSPVLYTLYIRLKEAYERKKLDEILVYIQMLNNELLEDLYANHLEFGTIVSESWENSFLNEIKETTPLDESLHPLSSQVKLLPLIHWSPNDFPPPPFQHSYALLKSLDDFLLQEVEAYVSRIKFYSSHNLHSVTSPRYFGAIYMRLPLPQENPELFFLETLVHETSHLHLFAIMNQDILVLNEERDLFASPLRTDKRPMMGVFHAVFVLARMVRILRRYSELHPKSAEIENSLKKREAALQEGMSTISTKAQLSEKGKIFFSTIFACAYE